MTGSWRVAEIPGFVALRERQAGVARRNQLHALGLTSKDIATQFAACRWTRIAPGLVWLYTGPMPRLARTWAAVLAAAPPVAVGSWTGLASWGLQGWPRDEIHVVVPRGARVQRLRGVVIHWSRRMAVEDLRLCDGLPVLRVERCAIDAAAWQRSPRTAIGVLAAVVQQRLTTPEALWDQLDRVGEVRFRRLMRVSLADIRGGADALSEIDFVRLCRANGFPEPRRQVRRRDSRGRLRYLDVEWDLPGGRRLIVEIDGIGHMDAVRWYDDLLRDAELVQDAETITIRLPAPAVRAEPGRVVAILARHLPRLSCA